jgi:cell division protein FtsI (penicillin-binding protein 3)
MGSLLSSGKSRSCGPTLFFRRAFKASTARKILPAFEKVVNEGTAKDAMIAGVRVAGKTGTANKVVNGIYDRSKSRASFVGYFPADNPKVAMIIVMDEPRKSPYGGVVAAPVFRRVAERWINTMPEMYRLASGLRDSVSDTSEPDSVKFEIPEVVGQPIPIALAHLEAAGVQTTKIRNAKSNWIVDSWQPEGKVLSSQSNKVKLEASDPGDKSRVMPDLKGLGVRQATTWLMSNGVDVTVQGHGSITSQSPQPGEALTSAATLRATR